MTQEQIKLYWREFNLTQKALQRAGYELADIEEWRKDTTIKALGREKSSKLLTDRDLDMMLQHFRAVSDPGDFDVQMKLENAEKNRLVFGINRDSLGDEWLAVMVHNIYGHTRWQDLPLGDLLKVRRRCANARRAAKKAQLSDSVLKQALN